MSGRARSLRPGRGRDLHDAVVAVTGAGSGIGRALAAAFAAEGAILELSDVDAESLEATAAPLRSSGVRVGTTTVDVADRAGVRAWADRVAADHGRVNVIVNNAGVVSGCYVDELDLDDWDRVLGINLGGAVNGTVAFLPHLHASMWGHVVNISSMLGVLAVPTMASYVASKAAVRGFTETLAMELLAARSTVAATVVMPGGVQTNLLGSATMASPRLEELGADPDRLAEQLSVVMRTSAADAASAIVDGVRRRRLRVVIGSDAHATLAAQRLAPVGLLRLLSLSERVARSRVVRSR